MDIYLSRFVVSYNVNAGSYTYGLNIHGKVNPPPAGVYTVRITRRFNGTSYPIGTHPYGGASGFELLTNEVDYDWKLTIPSPSYDSIFFNNEPFIWSSNGNNSDGWVSTHRFVTNSDFNKNISSVRYQNTQVQYSGGEVLYLGTWYKSVDTRVKFTNPGPNLNERGGFLIPARPNPSSFLFPQNVTEQQHVQGEGNKFTNHPPLEGDGWEIIITDYEP